ncbi:MAG TPA: hypothetical protein VGL56_05945 [Fimbriimonadaceae bacterium]|jgi:hypothetical protein
MPDEKVDGFSDVAENVKPADLPDAADLGMDEHAKEPLDPEERAELEKEIREGDQEGHHGHVPEKE